MIIWPVILIFEKRGFLWVAKIVTGSQLNNEPFLFVAYKIEFE